MNIRYPIAAAITTGALILAAAPAGATEIAQVEGSCDGTFHVTGVPANLDVRINGTVYTADTFTFVDRDGTFDIEYFNQSGEWGSTHYDFTIAECAPTTTPPEGSSTTLPGTPTTAPASTVPGSTLPATGGGSSPLAVTALTLLAAGGGLIVLTRKRATR